MPQIAKGAKWAYGWVVVADGGEVPIPPEAWLEYGFRAGGEAVFVAGSIASGGFGICTPKLLAAVSRRLRHGSIRVLGTGEFTSRRSCSSVPGALAAPGDRLLAVRGSRFGLGFVARGRIYQEAVGHPGEIETFRGVG